MEEGIRNERFSSGARAVGRSSASPDGERFSMATKSIVLAATIATVSLVDSVRLSPALTCFYCSTLLRADSVPWLSRCWFSTRRCGARAWRLHTGR